MNLSRQILLAVLGMLPWLLAAQPEPPITVFRPEDGHPVKYATSLEEDKHGVLWLMTREGLFRFDGQGFINIGQVNGELKNLDRLDIRNMCYLPDRHELWMRPFQAEHLLVMDLETFHVRKLPSPLAGQEKHETRGLQKDLRGNLMWTIFTPTQARIFKIIPPDDFQEIVSSPIDDPIRMLGFDNQGRFYYQHHPPPNPIIRLSADGQDTTLLDWDKYFTNWTRGENDMRTTLGWDKFYYWEVSTKNVFTIDLKGQNPTLLAQTNVEINPSQHFISHTFDRDGNIWYSYWEHDGSDIGMLSIDKSGDIFRLDELGRKAGIKFTNLRTRLEDSSRNIWLVTDQGIIRFPNPRRLFGHHLSSNSEAHFSSTRSIVENENGNLYTTAHIGNVEYRIYGLPTGGKGAAATPSEKIQSKNSPPPTWSSLLEMDTSNQVIWYLYVRNEKFLVRYHYQEGVFESHPLPEELRFANQIPGICLLPDHQLLFGAYLDHLYIFDTQSKKLRPLSLPFPEKNQNQIVKNIIRDQEGNIWITASGELYRIDFKENQVRHFSSERMGFRIETEMIVDGDGSIWANAFRTGLAHFDPHSGNTELFDETDGLSNNQVASIVPYGSKLYLGTFNGLSVFDKEARQFQNFSTTDGLSHNEFNYFSKHLGSDGKIYLGGMEGINYFHPDSLVVRKALPPLQWLYYSTFDRKSDSLIVQKNGFQDFTHLYVPPSHTYFELSWVLPAYSRPESNHYYTWLEGFEKDWQYRGSENKIRYNTLPAGSYTLHVKGTDPAGAPSERNLKLDIEVGQYFYQSRWFFFILVLAAGAIIYLVVNYRFQQKLKIERMRSTIASDLHDEVGSSLTHLSMLINAVDIDDEKANAKTYLQKGNEVLMNAISKIRDVVWAIDSRNDESGDLIDRMEDFAFDMLRAKNIKYTFKHENLSRKLTLPPLLRQNIYLIFKEAVNNVVKHSSADFVAISLTKKGNRIHLLIKDNGQDVNPDKMNGQGLANMKLRAKRVNGEAEIQSGEDGFLIKLSAPITS